MTMWSWEDALMALLGRGKGTIRMTSPSRRKPVTGSQPTGEAEPTGPSNHRATLRFHVQFRTLVSGTGTGTVVEGTGTLLDLSLGGCRVEAPIAVEQHLLVELRIYVPDLDWPLMVDGAVVQWAKENTFALRFLRLRQSENNRLARVIAKIVNEGNE